jgi:ABC-type multidrug transport system fused ATPase/permease subunit
MVIYSHLIKIGDEASTEELNLTQTQKQRISLARCIYHDPDIILLEDFFGSFDVSAAKRLFTEVIKLQLSKGKCVVLYTQQKKFLRESDKILVLKNGKVIEEGTYPELKERKVNFATYVSDYTSVDDDPTGILEQGKKIQNSSL